MFLLLIRAGFISLILLNVSCGFADLRPIVITTVPEGPWAMLPEPESPVIVRFNTEMEKPSVEKALQITSPNGIAEGEFRWEENDLYFVPSVPWKPGLRYGLKLSGTISACDGRESPVFIDFPFFAVSHPGLPYVDAFSPADGASVGVSPSIILELNFSQPMDERSTEDALRLDIPGKRISEWLDENKTLRISSDKPLNPWTVYHWSISEKALSRDGAPLAKDFSGRFITDLEKDFLSVVRVIPLLPPEPFPVSYSGNAEAKAEAGAFALWGSWIPAGANLEQGPGSGQGIGVEFNKPVESNSLRRAFSFVPSLPGRVEILSPVSAVFIPSRDPEPETVYNMRISGVLRDSDGLMMGEDYTCTFKTDIPFLYVNAVSFGQDGEIISPESGSLISVKAAPGRILRYVLHFSLPFDSTDTAARDECAFRITLRPFFPATLPSVNLRSARWLSSDRLLMEWEGAEGGNSEEPQHYRLLIPGGPNGVHNGRGSFLQSDFILYLEVEK